MKYWEIIADKLSKPDWSWGYCSAVMRNGRRWVVDARSGGSALLTSWHEPLDIILWVRVIPERS